MESYLKEFIPPQRILMGAGPSNVHPRVLRAIGTPIVGHLDPSFLKVMDDVMEMLRIMFGTSNRMTLPISATGTAAMEAAICNVVEPGDTVIIATNGFFGARLADIASRCGAQVHTIDFPWGKPVDPSDVETEMRKHTAVKALGVIHGETSTGVLSPLTDLANLAHHHDSILIADAVTSLGGQEFKMDQWDIDVAYSASQKCLASPPGLAPISVGPRAEKLIKERKTPVQSFYLNLGNLETYWSENQTRVYHHTAPISMIYALRESLRMAMEEGIEARILRHARNAAALRAGLESLGLALFADPDHRLNPLTIVLAPEGVDEAQVRRRLLQEYSIEIAGGLGQIAGRVWRIGLMGETSREANVLLLLSALERILPGEGYEVAQGAAVASAQQVLASE